MKSKLFLFCLVALFSFRSFAAGSESCTTDKTTVRFESAGNDTYNVTSTLNGNSSAYKTIPNLACTFVRDGSHTFFCKGMFRGQGVTVRSMYALKQFMTNENTPIRTHRFSVLAEYYRQNSVQFDEEMLATTVPLNAVQCTF